MKGRLRQIVEGWKEHKPRFKGRWHRNATSNFSITQVTASRGLSELLLTGMIAQVKAGPVASVSAGKHHRGTGKSPLRGTAACEVKAETFSSLGLEKDK